MKTLAIFALALFAVVMAQDRVKVVDNNPIIVDPYYSQPHAPSPGGYQQPSYGPAYVNPYPNGDYRKEWAATHNVSPNARGVNVVDNNPILRLAPSPGGYEIHGHIPAVQPSGDYRVGWAASHKVPPGARGGK